LDTGVSIVKDFSAKTLVGKFSAVEDVAGAKVFTELWGHGRVAVGFLAQGTVAVVIDAADSVGSGA
jgi:hypothetical protein